ncbi:MAG: hypothetical protein EBV03_07405, partial [Proteobacteria bacterium]|nr:hypothetical protein [Pseudomonadota bacterium]
MHDHSHMQPGAAAHACCAPHAEAGADGLKRLQFRLIASAALTLPLLFMGHHSETPWLQALLAAPVVLWGGADFFRQAFAALKARQADMFTLLALSMGISYAYSLLAWLLPAEPMPLYFESGAMIATLALLGQYLEARAGERMGDAVRALLNLVPETAELLVEGGGTQTVAAAQLQPGYWVRVLPGARVPADGVVGEGESELDESMLTGEAKPVAKAVGDRVTGGSINGMGSLLVQVERVGADTTLSRMAALVAGARASRPRS